MHLRAQAPVRLDFGGAWTDVDLYAQEFGGAVFNATINHYVTGEQNVTDEGLQVRYGFELPTGSGLGTSAALNVCWFGLIGGKTDPDRCRVAEQAYGLEALLGILGGRQDQYAAAFGGFNLMRFGGGSSVEVEQVTLAPEMITTLEKRSVLVYTGTPRLSGNIHENVWGGFRSGRKETVAAFHGLKEVGLGLPEALKSGDFAAFAALLAQNWEHQKNLDPSVSNAQIEKLFVVAESAGAIGGKACGAGGGGCLYFVTEEGTQLAVVNALVAAGARYIPFQFEREGLQVAAD
jgi:D-glycero-alpha-D-manno-heptose-7-phosphate kinase